MDTLVLRCTPRSPLRSGGGEERSLAQVLVQQWRRKGGTGRQGVSAPVEDRGAPEEQGEKGKKGGGAAPNVLEPLAA